MKKLTFAFALLAVSAFAAEWKGTISDSGCGAKHADASEGSMACVKKCVGGGAKAVFVSEGKVLKIDEASMDKVKEHLGHKVVLTGKLDGETVTVDSVKMQ
ncbi:MAG TPA: hypothetical protein VEQ63_12580 [Bryobacteraceae bacterium]|nr:hypothetical protein [Bryobacteraceae bacterium]